MATNFFPFSAQNFDGTVYTFGFGADHDARMLEPLSTQGGGVYYYIDSADKVRDYSLNITSGAGGKGPSIWI